MKTEAIKFFNGECDLQRIFEISTGGIKELSWKINLKTEKPVAEMSIFERKVFTFMYYLAAELKELLEHGGESFEISRASANYENAFSVFEKLLHSTLCQRLELPIGVEAIFGFRQGFTVVQIARNSWDTIYALRKEPYASQEFGLYVINK